MIKRIVNETSVRIRRSWRQLALGCGVAGLVGLGFCWGRSSAQTIPGRTGAPPAPPLAAIIRPGGLVPNAPVVPENGSDYSRRVVAYVYHNIPITREELGEYLIARYGVEKVESLVNRKIIDMACRARGIQITDGEVNSAFEADLKELGILREEDFEKKILKPRNATLFQWKEDVLRPKLALTKFCQDRIKVTEEDLQKAFENRFGPKVQCRMILVPPPNENRLATGLWERVRKSPEEFDREARTQAVAALAARGGEVPPICKHCGADKIEEQAFNLKVGEISGVIGTPDGNIILKCVAHLPPENKRFEEVRPKLMKEIVDRKIMEEIPKVMKELRARAEPQFFFKKSETAEDLYRDAARSSGLQPTTSPAGPAAPQGH